MAGFFGLFDYSKPGPGVEKNAPKKKAFVIFFDIYFRKFWKLVTVNLLFVLVSLPVVTTGFANAGLTYITRNFAREKHAFVSADFFDTIKKNWKQALTVGIINGVITLILFFDLYLYYKGYFSSSGIVNMVLLAVIAMLTIVFTFMKYYMYMMLITFKLTLKQLYKNSLIFAFAGAIRNLLMALLFGFMYACAALLIFVSPAIGITVVFLVYVFLFPAFRSFLIQYATFPLIKKHMIDPYYQEHPDEDKAAKQALNIQDEDETEDDEDRVFEDTLPNEDEPPKTTFPRQYSEQEMKKLSSRSKRNRGGDSDDDGTI